MGILGVGRGRVRGRGKVKAEEEGEGKGRGRESEWGIEGEEESVGCEMLVSSYTSSTLAHILEYDVVVFM